MPAMTPLLMSLAAFACIFGGTFPGIFVRRKLPGHHLTGDTQDIVRQGTGLIATLASLVLGLLIASANGKFEAESSNLKQLIAHIILLDNSLALFGQDAEPARVLLRRDVDLPSGSVGASGLSLSAFSSTSAACQNSTSLPSGRPALSQRRWT